MTTFSYKRFCWDSKHWRATILDQSWVLSVLMCLINIDCLDALLQSLLMVQVIIRLSVSRWPQSVKDVALNGTLNME